MGKIIRSNDGRWGAVCWEGQKNRSLGNSCANRESLMTGGGGEWKGERSGLQCLLKITKGRSLSPEALGSPWRHCQAVAKPCFSDPSLVLSLSRGPPSA